jgi:DNA-binding transcriptional regulator YiaG
MLMMVETKMGNDLDETLISESDENTAGERASFASSLRYLRHRLAGKQVWLSGQIGCSDAAISFWESGARFPSRRNLSRLLAALAEGGASTSELLALRRTWHNDFTKRSLSRSSSQ